MNTIIFQTIRATGVLAVAFFAFIGSVFAAPTLAPVTATRITDTSATIVGHVSNPYKSSTVWFEFYNESGVPTVVGMEPPLYGEATFEWNLRDLNPGQTYSYRSVAMEGGATVYSQPSTFTTSVPKPISVAVSYQSNSSRVTQSSVTKVSQTKSQSVATVTTKPNTTTATAAPVATVAEKEGFTNGNSAAVIGAENNMFPSTFIGWLFLFVLILVAITMAHMLYEAPERRRVARIKKIKSEDEELAAA